MNVQKYPVAIGETAMVYEFVSIGVKGAIPKLIIFSETEFPNYYNLAFGDKDEATGEINDLVVSNNGDSERVLATVASTLYSFTDVYPTAIIFVTGSTKARTRLYKRGISNYLQEIEKDFSVFGFFNNKWQRFDKHLDFDAFLVKRKI